MIQIVALIVLASGTTATASLPYPTFQDVAACEAYLKSEEFKPDLHNLTEQIMGKFHQGFTFRVSCELRRDKTI